MERKSLILAVILVIGTTIAFLWPTNMATPQANARSINSPGDVYLPLIINSIPPCGTLPMLLAPPDGSIVTLDTIFKFDGRGEGLKDWVELNFNVSKDFVGNSIGYAYQPADLWEIPLRELDFGHALTPGKWYWRASLWCNGPGWPPPPQGYYHSPNTGVWSFTLQ